MESNLKVADEIEIALEFLKDFVGERIAGTEGEEIAREKIKAVLKEFGVQWKEESFEIYISRGLKGRVKVKGGPVIDALPFSLSVPFKAEGRLAYYDTGEEALKRESALKGKICLLARKPKFSTVLKLAEYGCKGIIPISPPHRYHTAWHYPQKAIKLKPIPAITVSIEQGWQLLPYLGKEILIEGEGFTEKREAKNLIVSIPGRIPDRHILITAHYDTTPTSLGFSDNGGGVAVLLALISYFSREKPDYTLDFIFFSGEEWGLVGSWSYVNRHREELDNVVLGINIDVAGCPIGFIYSRITGSKYLERFVKAVADRTGTDIETVQNIYSSDSIPFAYYGLPFVNLSRYGGKATLYFHTPFDRPYYIHRAGIEKVFLIARGIIEDSMDIDSPGYRKIPRFIRERAKRYIEERYGN